MSEFDPAEDTPSSANLLQICDTYEELLEQGHEEAAKELRAVPTVSQQIRRHIQLKKEYLIETDVDREIVPDRTFDMTVLSTPEDVKDDVDAWMDKRAAKQDRMKDALEEKKERVKQRLSDSNE